jgi:hypothetical protein
LTLHRQHISTPQDQRTTAVTADKYAFLVHKNQSGGTLFLIIGYKSKA